MSASVTIALDAMGGDYAPGVVLKGADIALVRYPAARFLLFGDESRVAPLLAKLPRLAKATTLFHTDEEPPMSGDVDDMHRTSLVRLASQSARFFTADNENQGTSSWPRACNLGALIRQMRR